MSELTDAIKAAGPESVAAGIANDPTFRIFNLLWNSAEELIPACDRMGWQTLDDLLAWVRNVNTAIGDTTTFEALIDPPVSLDLSAMPTVDMPTIHAAVVAQCKLRDDFFIDQSDALYRLPTKSQWELLAASCPIKRRKWAAETMDCDDYTNAFRGWLASKGLGNLAQGFCGMTMYDYQDDLMGGHAVALVMDDTRKLWWLEPQFGKLYEVTHARLGGMIFAKTVKIARAYF